MSKLMSKGLFAAIAMASAALAGGVAQANCLQPQPVRVCTEFFHSDNVVVAKILSMRKIPNTPDPNNIEGWFYKIAVEKSYRGDKLPNDEIYTGNDETRFMMEVGKSYLLFINKNPQSRPAPDNCGNSSELSKADASVAAIDKILKAAATGGGGDIGGQLMLAVPGSQALSNSGAPDISLTVKSFIGRDQTMLTDQQGRFNIHLPSGHYSVVGASASWDISSYALAYMKPMDFQLQDGGCADLMLLAQPK